MEVNDAKRLRLRGLGTKLKNVGRRIFRRPSRPRSRVGTSVSGTRANGIDVKPSRRRRLLKGLGKGLGGILGTTLLGVGIDQAINSGSTDEEYDYYG